MVSYNEFCHAEPSSLVFLHGVKFSRIVIHKSKFQRMDYIAAYTEATLNMENYVVSQSRQLFQKWFLSSSLFF